MVYYVQTNLIAIIVGAILLWQMSRTTSKKESSQIIMKSMVVMLIVCAISDICAYISRGDSYLGVQVSNIVYFITMALGCYLWFFYVLVKVERVTNLRKGIIITSIPMFILCLAIATNFLTSFFFTIDSENLYHRGPGVMLTWVVEWAYVLIALGVNIAAIVREKETYKRSEYKGNLVFMVPIAVAAICQMLFYGTTTNQIGFMIALLMAFINKQHFQVQRDALTGLNNKNAFMKYRDSMLNQSEPINLTLFMIDCDGFKSINDTYGHLKGDQALRDIADVLKWSCATMDNGHVMLFRYAGDEFAVAGHDLTTEDVGALLIEIDKNLVRMNERNMLSGEKYKLAFSIGFAQGMCEGLECFDTLFKAADEDMYRSKRKKKVQRATA